MQTIDELKKLSKEALEQKIAKAKWDSYIVSAKMCVSSINFPKSMIGELNQLKELIEARDKEKIK